jgi:hypothetical protein
MQWSGLLLGAVEGEVERRVLLWTWASPFAAPAIEGLGTRLSDVVFWVGTFLIAAPSFGSTVPWFCCLPGLAGLAVLCGRWPGQRWRRFAVQLYQPLTPLSLYDPPRAVLH